MMAFGDGEVKGRYLKGIQRLRAPPKDGPVLQIPGQITIGSR